jgi:hypothetical protein
LCLGSNRHFEARLFRVTAAGVDFGMLHIYRFTTKQRIADYVNGRLRRIELSHRLDQICLIDRKLSAPQNDMAISFSCAEAAARASFRRPFPPEESFNFSEWMVTS